MTEDGSDKPQDPDQPDRSRRPVGQGVPSSPRAGDEGRPPSRPPGDEAPWEDEEAPYGADESWGEDEDRDQDPWRQELGEDWDEEEDRDEQYSGYGEGEQPEELEGYAEESWDGSAISDSTEAGAVGPEVSDAATAVEPEPSTAKTRATGGGGRRGGRGRSAEDEDGEDAEEDEINAATMSLGEHLDELRKRLIYALLGLLLMTIATVIFGKTLLLNQLNAPYFSVARQLNQEIATEIGDLIQDRRKELGISPKELADKAGIPEVQLARLEAGDSKNAPPASTLELIEEEVKLSDNELTDLHRQVMNTKFIQVKAISAFLMYFKVALLGGLILASPWVFYHLWMFVAAGLYRREKRLVHIGLPFSVGLFVAGAVFFLKIVSHAMLQFFMRFARWLDVAPYITLQNHIGMMIRMMVVFGLAFQMPLAVFILGKVGLVSLRTLNKYRRHVIVAMLIVAAIFTSPSPVDQVLLALPMWLLYELGVLLVWMAKRKEAREDAQYEDAESAD